MPSPVFAALGNAHVHQLGMASALRAAGGQCRWVWDADPAQALALQQAIPGSTIARCPEEVLADPGVHLVCGAVPPEERAALGIAVLAAGKDYLTAKPGLIRAEELAQVRAAVARTGRRYLVFFTERFLSPLTARAEDLVRQGAIGRVRQVLGLGPHRLGGPRPAWFWDRARSGGIINDLGSHQFDQILLFTGSTTAEVTGAWVQEHPQGPDQALFQDLGEAHLVTSSGATGSFRVDWLSPAGLPTWGDSRTFLTGSEGSLEIRRTIDPGRGDGLLVRVDRHGVTQETIAACAPHPFLAQVLVDAVEGMSTAMAQDHVLEVLRLGLVAQALAEAAIRPSHPAPSPAPLRSAPCP